MAKSNEDRRAEALARRIEKAHDWRVRVWAQSELRIIAMNAEMETLGYPPPALFKPDFSDRKMLLQYAPETGTNAAV